MEGVVKCYRDLVVWKHGIDLVVNVYDLSKRFPAEERYVLCSQIQRAAISIPANIAEVMLVHPARNSCTFSPFRSALSPNWKHI